MIPLRDNIPSSRPPYVNYGLIALNCLLFLAELSSGPHLPALLSTFGFVPGRFLSVLSTYGPLALPVAAIPMVSSIFLHGGWLHLIGNMWFLYIFGDNVEDFLGHGRYFLFYLLSVVPPPTPQGGFGFVPLPILARDVLNSFSLGLSVNVDDVIFIDILFLLVALAGLLSGAGWRARTGLPAGFESHS